MAASLIQGEALWGCEQEPICGALGLLDMARTWGDGLVPLLLAALAHHGRPAKRLSLTGSGPPEFWEPFAGYDPLATAKLLGERSRAWFPTAFSTAGPPLPDSPFVGQPVMSGSVRNPLSTGVYSPGCLT